MNKCLLMLLQEDADLLSSVDTANGRCILDYDNLRATMALGEEGADGEEIVHEGAAKFAGFLASKFGSRAGSMKTNRGSSPNTGQDAGGEPPVKNTRKSLAGACGAICRMN